MPKNRGIQKKTYEKRLFIVCEGSKEKSEDAYLTGFIKTCRIPATVKIEVVDTSKNTGKELVEVAKDLKEFNHDEAWVVYDKDGYSKHPATFEAARIKGVNIAFSSISFEVWVLLHFCYTTKVFDKSKNVIDYMKDKGIFQYAKNLSSMYQDVISAGGSIETAIKNAKKIQKYQFDSNPSHRIYDFDTFTNMNELIKAIRQMEKKKNK